MMIGNAMTPFDPVFTVNVKKVDDKFDVTVAFFDVKLVSILQFSKSLYSI